MRKIVASAVIGVLSSVTLFGLVVVAYHMWEPLLFCLLVLAAGAAGIGLITAFVWACQELQK